MPPVRLAYIDCLKGFAIFLVVLGHVVQNYNLMDSWIFRIIYSFHMPLFMFMSGYVCFRKYDWTIIKKRGIQLLIPFFSYIPVKYGLDILLTGNQNISLLEYICRVVYHPDGGLWFLWALFFITVLFIASRRIARKINLPEWIVFAAVAGLLNGIVIFGNVRQFGFHWIAWYFIYFCAGVMWRTWNENKNDTRKFDFRLLISCAIVFPVMVYFFRMHNEPPTFYQWINLGRLFPVVYRLVIGMVGTMLVYELFKLYNKQTERLHFLSKMGGGNFGNILYSLPCIANCIHVANFWKCDCGRHMPVHNNRIDYQLCIVEGMPQISYSGTVGNGQMA
ncbi:acyltransferase family protein [Muribaculum intestinale]|uniref:acyltransferase family protein n=1 Tax=Muribaculum intestinale TaxID=1796646 RepID=UPI00242F2071|nr:acyltransferase [Muribaculum intestinale]